MNKRKGIFLIFVALCIGILIGGYLFSKSQPRSLIALNQCRSCLTQRDFLGLLASAGIEHFSGAMPMKVCETDKTIAVKLPFSSERRVHYVIIPKKDIKNMGEISGANEQYFTDAFYVARWLVEHGKLKRYRFYTNGPELQAVTYLHFHLVVE